MAATLQEHELVLREKFFRKLPPMKQSQRRRIHFAYDLGVMVHKGVTRDDSGVGYFEGHVLPVARTLRKLKYCTPGYIIGALLHDALEDSLISYMMLEELFGPRKVRSLLALSKSYAVEEPVSGSVLRTNKKSHAAYFEGLRAAGKKPIRIKLADRYCNLRDLVNPPAGSRFTIKKRESYIEETRTYLLPLADTYEPRLAVMIRKVIAEIEENIRQRRAAGIADDA